MIQLADGCEVVCIDDTLVVWVYVGNAGPSPLTLGATIDFYATMEGAETLVGSQFVAGPIAPGEYLEALTFEIPAAGVEQLRVQGNTMEQECDATNNAATKTFPFCGPPPG